MAHPETCGSIHPVQTSGPTLGILPLADDPAPNFAGFGFEGGATTPHAAGLFILTRRIGTFLYPALIGEAEDIAAALADVRARDAVAAQAADGQFWMLRPQPRQRSHIARELIIKFHPPLNTEHRKGPAAPELAALIPDRAEAALAGNAAPPVGAITATEADLARLVEVFYAAARADPVIGPVFNRTVADWDQHARTVANFWSRAMLG